MRAGDSRGGQVSHCLARVTQRHGHRLLFARPLFGKNAWAGQAGILVACNLCGANIRMLVSSGIISGGNEILYKMGGARVSQIFLTDVLQLSNKHKQQIVLSYIIRRVLLILLILGSTIYIQLQC